MMDKYPAITRALWWIALVDEAVLREWIVNVSRRSAEQAVAHLFCELLARARKQLNQRGLLMMHP